MIYSLHIPPSSQNNLSPSRSSVAVPPPRPHLIANSPVRNGESAATGARWQSGAPGVPLLIGRSLAISRVISDVELVADRACSVLIEGETGTGKEVVARAIHALGSRSKGPWVAVNCGAIPEALLEAELFGHVRGAFTGAVQARAGKFEAANRGTIFLDEITELPLGLQAKLLRVLQEREVERLGGNERIRLDVRVIAATNAGLAERVRKGLFREDLFYRLNVFRISVPPLRERRDDIPLLVQHFMDKVCRSEGCRSKTIDSAAMEKLMGHHWPGNIRELENAIESAAILSANRALVTPEEIRFATATGDSGSESEMCFGAHLPEGGIDFQKAVEEFEQRILTQALLKVRGNKTAAAELLGLKRTTLAAKMRALESRLPRLVA